MAENKNCIKAPIKKGEDVRAFMKGAAFFSKLSRRRRVFEKVCVIQIFLAIAVSIEGAEVNDLQSLQEDTGLNKQRLSEGLKLLVAEGIIRWVALGTPKFINRCYRLDEDGREIYQKFLND